MIGGRHDRRRLLLAGASLMIATAVAFALVHEFALLLVVAFAVTINPSAGSVSIFVPLERAVLSGEVADRSRTRMFARHSLIGDLRCGHPRRSRGRGHGPADGDQGHVRLLRASRCDSMSALRAPAAACGVDRPGSFGALGPSRHIVYRLAALFSVDAFAGGFVVQSLLAPWLFKRFAMSLSAASLFFFWSGLLSAFSVPVAA